MRQWKAAGPAPRDVDDALWKRFRGAQDTFFGARDAANAEQDAEFAANAEVKEELLVEAEALVPVTDLEAAKRAFRDIAERWDAAGKVPRDRMKELEGRIRKVEQADPRRSRTSSGGAPTPRSPPAPTTWSPSSRRPSPRSRPTSPRPRAAGDEKKVKDLEETSPRAGVPRHGQREAAADSSAEPRRQFCAVDRVSRTCSGTRRRAAT